MVFEFMKFEDQYSTEEWAAKREKIFRRDRYRCTNCESDEKLQCHHKRYPGDGNFVWQVPDDWLETLCEDCHKTRTLIEREIRMMPMKRLIEAHSFPLSMICEIKESDSYCDDPNELLNAGWVLLRIHQQGGIYESLRTKYIFGKPK